MKDLKKKYPVLKHIHDWRLLTMFRQDGDFWFYCTKCLEMVKREESLDKIRNINKKGNGGEK